jgi:hypothetical protein
MQVAMLVAPYEIRFEEGVRMNVSSVARGFVGFGFVIPAPIVFGTYSVRILVNNEAGLNTHFSIQATTPQELSSVLVHGGSVRPN